MRWALLRIGGARHNQPGALVHMGHWVADLLEQAHPVSRRLRAGSMPVPQNVIRREGNLLQD